MDKKLVWGLGIENELAIIHKKNNLVTGAFIKNTLNAPIKENNPGIGSKTFFNNLVDDAKYPYMHIMYLKNVQLDLIELYTDQKKIEQLLLDNNLKRLVTEYKNRFWEQSDNLTEILKVLIKENSKLEWNYWGSDSLEIVTRNFENATVADIIDELQLLSSIMIKVIRMTPSGQEEIALWGPIDFTPISSHRIIKFRNNPDPAQPKWHWVSDMLGSFHLNLSLPFDHYDKDKIQEWREKSETTEQKFTQIIGNLAEEAIKYDRYIEDSDFLELEPILENMYTYSRDLEQLLEKWNISTTLPLSTYFSENLEKLRPFFAYLKKDAEDADTDADTDTDTDTDTDEDEDEEFERMRLLMDDANNIQKDLAIWKFFLNKNVIELINLTKAQLNNVIKMSQDREYLGEILSQIKNDPIRAIQVENFYQRNLNNFISALSVFSGDFTNNLVLVWTFMHQIRSAIEGKVFAKHKKNIAQFDALHQLWATCIQFIAPLIVATYSTPDMASIGDGGQYTEASFRLINAQFTFLNSTNIKEMGIAQSRSINPQKSIYSDMYQKFEYDPPFKKNKAIVYGVDFRKDPEKGDNFGLEFRILDTFNPKILKEIIALLFLLADHLRNQNISLHTLDNPWNNKIMNQIIVKIFKQGWNARIPHEYIQFINKNLKLSLIPSGASGTKAYNLLVDIYNNLRTTRPKTWTHLVFAGEALPEKLTNLSRLHWNFFLNAMKESFADDLHKVVTWLQRNPSATKEQLSQKILKVFGNQFDEDVEDLIYYLTDEGIYHL